MKTTILLAVGLLTVGGVGRAWGQQGTPVDSVTHKIAYSAVVQVPGASQAELYGRALRWLAAAVPHATTGWEKPKLVRVTPRLAYVSAQAKAAYPPTSPKRDV